MTDELGFEPVPGLPGPLPEGEAILWQGAPAAKAFARRVLHLRQVSVYFALLALWAVVSGLSDGAPVRHVALNVARLAAMAVVAEGLLSAYAWAVGRSTIYTVTTRRVVLRFGVALPMTIQIPFARIDSAGLHTWRDGAGDIALSLRSGEKISWLLLWPHARPWRIARAEPTLRAIPDAAAVAQVLARALAGSAAQPARTVAQQDRIGAEAGRQLPAAA